MRSRAPTFELPTRLHSLDAVRGLAALAVVFWHWQHFFYQGTILDKAFVRSQQPLYSLFQPFYTDGWRAVDLFFCLSGFIFNWLYAQKIGERSISARKFALLRFSRLYPLHVMTLLLVAVGQAVMRHFTGADFVFENNNLFHFVLQLFFASNWGFERGPSFNVPIWSVSVEVFLYALFFCSSRISRTAWRQLAVFAVTGMILVVLGLSDLNRGILSFVVGGITFHLYARILRRKPTIGLLVGITLACAATWVISPWIVAQQPFDPLYRQIAGHGLTVRGLDPVGAAISMLSTHALELSAFPLSLLALALWEARFAGLGKRVAFLGDMSFSIYLLHFPLQFLFLGAALAMHVPRAAFYSPWMFLTFYAALVPLSLLSFRYFERPMQNLIRNRAKKPRDSDGRVAPQREDEAHGKDAVLEPALQVAEREVGCR